MALPILAGRGVVFAKNGINLSFGRNGNAVARFAVAFDKSKKDEYDKWERTNEILVQATAFGELAEFINDKFSHTDRIDIELEVEEVKFEKKDGNEGKAVQGIVRKVGAPIVKRENPYG